MPRADIPPASHASNDERRTVLVIQNTPTGDTGRVGDWLREAGLRLDVVHAYDGQELPARLGRRALIILGGGYLPDEDERAPWLASARRLTDQALAAERPMLGICLGGQLLAHVAGGTVAGRHGEPEYGSTPITIRPEGHADALFAGLPAVTPAIEHHVDAITALPAGATWLAESERCPYQGFRVGERAWGVQFHPEVGAARVRRWSPEDVRAAGFDPERLRARAVADEPLATTSWHGFTERFARLVATS
jgi:GMP synthase-like glutamine amidotransferase